MAPPPPPPELPENRLPAFNTEFKLAYQEFTGRLDAIISNPLSSSSQNSSRTEFSSNSSGSKKGLRNIVDRASRGKLYAFGTIVQTVQKVFRPQRKRGSPYPNTSKTHRSSRSRVKKKRNKQTDTSRIYSNLRSGTNRKKNQQLNDTSIARK